MMANTNGIKSTRKLRGLPPPPLRPVPSKSVIRIGVDLMRVVDDSISALATDLGIYQRDGQLVHIVRVPEDTKDASALAGTPQIRPLALASLRERLTSVALFQRYDGRSEDYKPCVPTDQVVQAVATRGQWKDFRPIVGIIESPSLRPDGSVLQTSGYDAATGFVYVPSVTFPAVPDAPTLADAQRALVALAEPLSDFPYPADAHRSATLAAILTLIARPAIVGCVPGFVFDASTRGSGKTLQSDVVSIIATGRASAKMGYPPDDIELEKVLGAYAMKGSLLINFDNVTRAYGGGPLDRCLTATDTVELRVLGRTEIPTLRWRGLIMASGNNVDITGDTARRLLVSRLEPKNENPEDRENFHISDLRSWCTKHRARLVVAALTILRAYVVAGRPNVGTSTWGSFESWSSLIPPALVWAGAADPMKTRPSIDATAEPEKAALGMLIEGWTRLAPDGLTTKAAIHLLYPVRNFREPPGPPDGHDDLREAIEILTHSVSSKSPTSKQLGYLLRRNRKRFVSGRYIDCRQGRSGTVVWLIAVGNNEYVDASSSTCESKVVAMKENAGIPIPTIPTGADSQGNPAKFDDHRKSDPHHSNTANPKRNSEIGGNGWDPSKSEALGKMTTLRDTDQTSPPLPSSPPSERSGFGEWLSEHGIGEPSEDDDPIDDK